MNDQRECAEAKLLKRVMGGMLFFIAVMFRDVLFFVPFWVSVSIATVYMIVQIWLWLGGMIAFKKRKIR